MLHQERLQRIGLHSAIVDNRFVDILIEQPVRREVGLRDAISIGEIGILLLPVICARDNSVQSQRNSQQTGDANGRRYQIRYGDGHSRNLLKDLLFITVGERLIEFNENVVKSSDNLRRAQYAIWRATGKSLTLLNMSECIEIEPFIVKLQVDNLQ